MGPSSYNKELRQIRTWMINYRVLSYMQRFTFYRVLHVFNPHLQLRKSIKISVLLVCDVDQLTKRTSTNTGCCSSRWTATWFFKWCKARNRSQERERERESNDYKPEWIKQKRPLYIYQYGETSRDKSPNSICNALLKAKALFDKSYLWQIDLRKIYVQ